MHDNVFKTLQWFLGQISIESDAALAGISASPLCLHLPHEKTFHRHPQQG
jgi:hypothetical protein